MKIIDAHLHFRPGEREYFNQIAIAAGHENTEAHLRQEYARLGIVGGVVMGNGGVSLEGHALSMAAVWAAGRRPDFFLVIW